MNKQLENLGKFIFLLPLAIFGAHHFMGADNMAGMVPSYLPFAVIWVYLTGVALLAAVLAVIWGKRAKLALQLLGLMLLLFALMIHLPQIGGNNQAAMPSFLKDISLAGAACWASGQFDE